MYKLLIFVVLLFISSLKLYGQINFQKRIGSTSFDAASRVAALADGGLMVIGDHSMAGHDTVFMMRMDSLGHIEWSNKYWMDTTRLHTSFSKLQDGSFLLGATHFAQPSHPHLALFKIDSLGLPIWKKSYTFPHGAIYRPARTTNDGGLIIPFLYDTTIFQQQATGYGLLKTDMNGNVSWCKVFQIDSLVVFSIAIEQIADSGFLFIGNNYNFDLTQKIDFIAKLDQFGNVLHINQYDDVGIAYEHHLLEANSNSYILATGNTYCIDSTGNLIWKKSYDGQINIQGALKLDDNSFALCGYQYDSSTTEALLIKIDSSGQFLSGKRYGSSLFRDYSLGFCLMNDGGFCHVGRTESFGADSVDIYLIRTDSTGYSGCNESSLSLNDDTVHVNSVPPFVMNVIDLTPVVSEDSIYSEPIIFAEFPLCSNVSTSILLKSSLQLEVSPNPSQSTVTFSFGQVVNQSYLEIYNITGIRVYSAILNGKDCTLNLGLHTGIYFVRINNNGSLLFEKLIIE